MKLKVCRCNSDSGRSRFDSFEFAPKPGMSVLSALFHVQDNLDGSLSFRYSCRGAVCGACAMLINKVPRLACRTQISSLLEGKDEVKLKPYPAIQNGEPFDPSKEILAEPLPHLPRIKDLVVDMTRFFDYYRSIEPFLKNPPRPSQNTSQNHPQSPDEKEWLMKPSDVTELERYTNCILCAACFGACPVDAKNPSYLGPAALAKLYRFHIDPREPSSPPSSPPSSKSTSKPSSPPSAPSSESPSQPSKEEGKEEGSGYRLRLADYPNGWWACEFHTNCKIVCPKGVPPNLAIGKARALLQKLAKEPGGV